MFKKIDFEDLSQLIIGASVLSVPIAFTEEAWSLSKTLPTQNIFLVMALTFCFLGIYAYRGIFQGLIKNRKLTYILRILIGYGVTVTVVSIVLLALNKLPLLTEPVIALKRIVIISFPASMGAIVVDSFDKE